MPHHQPLSTQPTPQLIINIPHARQHKNRRSPALNRLRIQTHLSMVIHIRHHLQMSPPPLCRASEPRTLPRTTTLRRIQHTRQQRTLIINILRHIPTIHPAHTRHMITPPQRPEMRSNPRRIHHRTTIRSHMRNRPELQNRPPINHTQLTTGTHSHRHPMRPIPTRIIPHRNIMIPIRHHPALIITTQSQHIILLHLRLVILPRQRRPRILHILQRRPLKQLPARLQILTRKITPRQKRTIHRANLITPRPPRRHPLLITIRSPEPITHPPFTRRQHRGLLILPNLRTATLTNIPRRPRSQIQIHHIIRGPVIPDTTLRPMQHLHQSAGRTRHKKLPHLPGHKQLPEIILNRRRSRTKNMKPPRVRLRTLLQQQQRRRLIPIQPLILSTLISNHRTHRHRRQISRTPRTNQPHTHMIQRIRKRLKRRSITRPNMPTQHRIRPDKLHQPITAKHLHLINRLHRPQHIHRLQPHHGRQHTHQQRRLTNLRPTTHHHRLHPRIQHTIKNLTQKRLPLKTQHPRMRRRRTRHHQLTLTPRTRPLTLLQQQTL